MTISLALLVAIGLNTEVVSAAEANEADQPLVICVGREATLRLEIQDSRLTSVSVEGGFRYVVPSPEPILTLADQTLVYEFIVDDGYDTNTYYSVGVLNGLITARHIYQNGNDSDTYDGWLVAEGDEAFICQ